MTAADSAVRVSGLWKRYGLPWPRRHGEWALRGLDLDVGQAETLGVIGGNGSGKSTLLKVVAGVTPVTRGAVTVRGVLFPMIELNAGLHPELTGRENITLLASVMGLSRRQLAARMDDIQSFCELGEWLERPVRTYSSGMLVRLGTAVGFHVDADIMLIDEVMAVGDLAFYHKCLVLMEQLRARRRCTVFVSHDLQRVKRLCDRVLVLERGHPLYLGPTEAGVALYEERSNQKIQGTNLFDYLGVKLAVITLRDLAGHELTHIDSGDAACLEFTLIIAAELPRVDLNVAVEDGEGVLVIWHAMTLEGLTAGAQRFRLTWRSLCLAPGEYNVRLGMGFGAFMMKGFRVNRALTLRVTGAAGRGGIYRPAGELVCLEP